MRKITFIIRITQNICWNSQSYFTTSFVPNFNLLSYKLDNFTFEESFYIDIILEQNKIVEQAVAKSYDDIHNTFTVPCEKSKMVSFASSIMKQIVAPSSRYRFPVKLICYIAFGSASAACCSIKSIAIILQYFQK